MSPANDFWNERGESTERLVFFSDAVFAIALTLLALDVRLPEEVGNLWAALLGISDTLLALIISFVTISAFWRSHHRMFRVITSYNHQLISLNFVLLFAVVVLPFTTSLISHADTNALAMIIYICNIGLASSMLSLIWFYVARQGMIDPALPAWVIQAYKVRALVITSMFFVAIPFTFIVRPVYTPLIWLLSAPIMHLVLYKYHARLQQEAQAKHDLARRAKARAER